MSESCGAGRTISHKDPASPFHAPCCAEGTMEYENLLGPGQSAWLCPGHSGVLCEVLGPVYGLEPPGPGAAHVAVSPARTHPDRRTWALTKRRMLLVLMITWAALVALLIGSLYSLATGNQISLWVTVVQGALTCLAMVLTVVLWHDATHERGRR